MQKCCKSDAGAGTAAAVEQSDYKYIYYNNQQSNIYNCESIHSILYISCLQYRYICLFCKTSFCFKNVCRRIGYTILQSRHIMEYDSSKSRYCTQVYTGSRKLGRCFQKRRDCYKMLVMLFVVQATSMMSQLDTSHSSRRTRSPPRRPNVSHGYHRTSATHQKPTWRSKRSAQPCTKDHPTNGIWKALKWQFGFEIYTIMAFLRVHVSVGNEAGYWSSLRCACLSQDRSLCV